MGQKTEKSNKSNAEYAYDVSVVVLTYNGRIEKIFETIHSILSQRDVCLQLILSDDGSLENHFEEIEHFLIAKRVTDYVLLSVPENQGTVKNALRGVQQATGEYVKLISPGDSLYGSNCLSNWLKAVRSAGAVWSFSDAIYYREEDGQKKAVQASARPILIGPYRRRQIDKMRWNYAVIGDVAMGAAILCRKDRMQEYLQRMAGQVIYAEDYMYKLMMFDGVVGMYYPHPTILYECGSGISTNDVWADRLHHDLKAVWQIMLKARQPEDPLQNKMAQALTTIRQRRSKRGPYCRGELLFWIKKKFFARRTEPIDLT